MRRFVTARPRYARGSLVFGTYRVGEVLFADAECEVYGLPEEGAMSELLIVLGASGSSFLGADALRGWIAAQGLSALQLDDTSLLVPVRGRRLADMPLQSFEESELYALLMSLIFVGLRAAHFGLRAVVTPPLLWVEGSWMRPEVFSMYARRRDGDESALLREVATTFLSLVTGLESLGDETLVQGGRLLSWCPGADAALERIISQCFGPQSSIRSLSALRLEVSEALNDAARSGRVDRSYLDRYVALGPYLVGRIWETDA